MASSIHSTLLEAAQTAVQDLNLTGISDSNVVILQAPVDRAQWLPALPGIVIAPIGVETFGAGTNASDDIGYPVAIVILAAANQDQTTSRDARLYWRELIVNQFIENRMPVSLTNATLFNQTIEGLPIVDAQAWFGSNLFVSGIVVRCHVRKARRL